MKNTDKIKMIKDQVSIADVLQHYNIKVNNRGWCFCCFHNDKKNPSMKVDYDANRVCCFGCHINYDVVDFVKNYTHSNDYKTFKIFENEFNVDLGNNDSEERRKKREEEFYFNEALKLERRLREKEKEKFIGNTSNYLIKRIRIFEKIYYIVKEDKEAIDIKCKCLKELQRLNYIYTIINDLPTALEEEICYYGKYGNSSDILLDKIKKEPEIIEEEI